MKKKLMHGILAVCMTGVIVAGTAVGAVTVDKQEEEKVFIQNYPVAADYSRPISELPVYDPNIPWSFQVDLRSMDLRKLDIADREKDLVYADFDDKTKWPEKLPANFKPSEIMELGKDPGLNVRKIHEAGITGKGVNIAIIDQPLLIDHKEYKGKIKHYEEFENATEGVSSMHGPAVTSIAVGNEVGVAPGADIYYIATYAGTFGEEFVFDFNYYARAIERILEINKTLPEDDKIRVISISLGFWEGEKGYKEIREVINKAKAEGMLVVTTSINVPEEYGRDFIGTGRELMKDPNEINSYEAGLFWRNNKDEVSHDELLLVPMDSRTTASPTGVEDYVFYRNGGMSWSVPYLAGTYALACEANPDITPDEFWNIVYKSADVLDNEKVKGKLINPVKIVDEAKNLRNDK